MKRELRKESREDVKEGKKWVVNVVILHDDGESMHPLQTHDV